VPNPSLTPLPPWDPKPPKKKAASEVADTVALGGANGNGCNHSHSHSERRRRDDGRFEARQNKKRAYEDASQRSRGGGFFAHSNASNQAHSNDSNQGNGDKKGEGEWTEVQGAVGKKEQEQQAIDRENAARAQNNEAQRTGLGDYDPSYDDRAERYDNQFDMDSLYNPDKSFHLALNSEAFPSIDHSEVKTYAQTRAKEIYFLTAALGQVMAIFSVLKEGGWATFKIHGGQTEESRCIAKMIRPFFEECELYPVSKAYTCHMLFAGKGFKRSKVDGMAIVSLMETCSSLNTSSLTHVCALIKREAIIPEADFELFENKVELTSQKMFMDWFDHNVAMSKASIQATLEGCVDPHAGYLLPKVGKLLNELVYSRVSQADLTRNRKTLHILMETPFGAQLQPLFVFTGPPPLSLVMSASREEQ
jgi:hypothetical protein